MTVKRIQSKIQKQIESYIHVKVHTTYNYKKANNKIFTWEQNCVMWHIMTRGKKNMAYLTYKKENSRIYNLEEI